MKASTTRGAARFLVLDGVDGCGKSTQAQLLVEALATDGGPRPLHVREPGSTVVGEAIRAILLAREAPLCPASEALLFTAARRQTLEELVAPALAQGRDVVCERFHPSTYAYQGVAGDLDAEEVLRLLTTWAGAPAPDLVVLLDLPVDEALARARQRGAADRFEARGLDFQRRVADGYRRYAERVPNAVVVDATGSQDEVAARVRAEVTRVDR